MKKIALLFTLTLVGTSMLNGMEPERGRYVGLGELSPEVQVMIIQALNSYDNLNDVINGIKAMSTTNNELNAVLNDMYGNLKKFTKLVHILADKFNTTTEIIAIEMATPAAKKYFELGSALMNKILIEALYDPESVINEITELIRQGVDVNYTNSNNLKPLELAITRLYPNIVKLLLNAGAKPNEKSLRLLNFKLPKLRKTEYEKAITIKKLFEESIKKPSS